MRLTSVGFKKEALLWPSEGSPWAKSGSTWVQGNGTEPDPQMENLQISRLNLYRFIIIVTLFSPPVSDCGRRGDRAGFLKV